MEIVSGGFNELSGMCQCAFKAYMSVSRQFRGFEGAFKGVLEGV